jgi:hypothetical protein
MEFSIGLWLLLFPFSVNSFVQNISFRDFLSRIWGSASKKSSYTANGKCEKSNLRSYPFERLHCLIFCQVKLIVFWFFIRSIWKNPFIFDQTIIKYLTINCTHRADRKCWFEIHYSLSDTVFIVKLYNDNDINKKIYNYIYNETSKMNWKAHCKGDFSNSAP